jgi:hypothetical protein
MQLSVPNASSILTYSLKYPGGACTVTFLVESNGIFDTLPDI